MVLLPSASLPGGVCSIGGSRGRRSQTVGADCLTVCHPRDRGGCLRWCSSPRRTNQEMVKRGSSPSSAGHADAEARLSVLTALLCATLVTGGGTHLLVRLGEEDASDGAPPRGVRIKRWSRRAEARTLPYLQESSHEGGTR
jgi:hypothetical protein